MVFPMYHVGKPISHRYFQMNSNKQISDLILIFHTLSQISILTFFIHVYIYMSLNESHGELSYTYRYTLAYVHEL